jgi:hypothetical protein
MAARTRTPRFDGDLQVALARRNGAPADVVQGGRRMRRETRSYIVPEREVVLLQAAFGDVRLF